jgi:hypothetical protein
VSQVCNRDLDAGPCSLGIEPRYRTTNPITEIDCSCKQGLLRSGRIEVEVIPGRPAAKALIDVSPQIGRKASAPGRGPAMHGTAAPNLVTGLLPGHETEQFQHLNHGHARTDILKSDARHGSNAARAAAENRRQGPRNREEEPVMGRHTATRRCLFAACSCRPATELGSTSLQAGERINFLECVFNVGKPSRNFFWKIFIRSRSGPLLAATHQWQTGPGQAAKVASC